MLDTVVLILERSQFEVRQPEKFDPPATAMLNGSYMPGKAALKAIQNHTKEDVRAGIYKPRLTIIRRKIQGGSSLTLKIEFSVPKLLFGNNLDEVCEEDFELVLDILEKRLKEMGVETRYEYLKNAKVSSIHFGKNVCMLDHATCRMVMQEISKVNLSTSLDFNKTDYRNGGDAIRFHGNTYEVVIYDKKKDMQVGARSAKRGLETDYRMQDDLFDWGKYPRQLEVLRLEIRIARRAKLNTLLKTLNILGSHTFAELFKVDVSRRILLHYWSRIKEGIPPLALGGFPPEDIFEALAAESKHPKPGNLFQTVGILLMYASVGEKVTRALVLKYGNKRTWQRIKRRANNPKILAKLRYCAMDNVDAILRRFETVKMSELEQLPVVPLTRISTVIPIRARRRTKTPKAALKRKRSAMPAPKRRRTPTKRPRA